jgi:hypothetical protein
MSRSSGKVKFKDDTILHCIYNGTVDYMHYKLFDTSEEAWYHYKNLFDSESSNTHCACEGEDVLIYSHYINGFTYTGKACKIHRCITFDFNNWLEYGFNIIEWNNEHHPDEQLKKEYEKILNDNWKKSGYHF